MRNTISAPASTLTISWIKDIRKFQSNLIASFSKTSFNDPRGQYSVRIKTVGDGEQRQAPINLTNNFI